MYNDGYSGSFEVPCHLMHIKLVLDKSHSTRILLPYMHIYMHTHVLYSLAGRRKNLVRAKKKKNLENIYGMSKYTCTSIKLQNIAYPGEEAGLTENITPER